MSGETKPDAATWGMRTRRSSQSPQNTVSVSASNVLSADGRDFATEGEDAGLDNAELEDVFTKK